MKEDANKSFSDYLRDYAQKIKDWIKPDPSDHLLLQFVKLIFKCIALLILIALSPIILVILLFVFFAAF